MNSSCPSSLSPLNTAWRKSFVVNNQNETPSCSPHLEGAYNSVCFQTNEQTNKQKQKTKTKPLKSQDSCLGFMAFSHKHSEFP